MKEAVNEAKEKAQRFLYQIIGQISEGIKKEEKHILYPSGEDTITLKFEAHAYLAHKNKKLKSIYAEELRRLWLHWKKSPRRSGNRDWEFWPFAGSAIETDIAMIRTMEVLGIPGFQHEIDSEVKAMEGWLIQPPLDKYSESNYWLIFRSKTIQTNLKQYIQRIAFMVLEDIKARDYGLPVYRYNVKGEFDMAVDAQISSIIFLVMSKLGGDYFKAAKSAIDKLTNYQENNGSLLNEIFLTSSFITAICLTESDPQKIIQKKALEWLLSRQNKNGSWDPPPVPVSMFLDWRVLSTVIVLETIDLITNHKPLPLWVLEEKPVSYPEREQKRIQPVKRFPTPPGTNWYAVSIRFLSEETVQIIAKSDSEGRNFREMGFMDRRTNNPDKLWWTLRLFAKHNGEISWETPGLPREPGKLKSYIKDIRKRLKHLFQIEDDPFEPYRKVRAYKTKFNIRLLDDIED